jgi:hypothetical protein
MYPDEATSFATIPMLASDQAAAVPALRTCLTTVSRARVCATLAACLLTATPNLAATLAAPQDPLMATITVVDADGRPAPGLRVRFGRSYEWTPSSGPRERRPSPEWVVTDARGQAAAQRLPGDERAVATILGPGIVPADKSDPLHIRLPQVGRLRVELGGLRSEHGTMLVRSTPGHDPSLYGLESIDVFRNMGTVVEIPYVALGGKWRIDFESALGAARTDAVGPTRPGEVVTVQLNIEPHATLTARLVDVAKVPIVGARIMLCAPDRAVYLASDVVVSDELGRISVKVDSRDAPASDLAEFLLREEVRRSARDEQRFGRGAVVARRPHLGAPLLDSGDVVLAQLPIAAAGIVRTGSGAPTPFAHVRAVLWPNPNATGPTLPVVTDSSPVVLAGLPFDHLAHATARSDGDGRFVLRGRPSSPAPPDREWFLVAKRTRYKASDGIPLRLGALDHKIRLGPQLLQSRLRR